MHHFDKTKVMVLHYKTDYIQARLNKCKNFYIYYFKVQEIYSSQMMHISVCSFAVKKLKNYLPLRIERLICLQSCAMVRI